MQAASNRARRSALGACAGSPPSRGRPSAGVCTGRPADASPELASRRHAPDRDRPRSHRFHHRVARPAGPRSPWRL